MIGVSVRSNIRQVAAEFRALSEQVTGKAIVRALNRALDSSQTAANREIRKTYNVKARAVSAAMKKRRATSGSKNPVAILELSGTRIALIEFAARKKWVKTRRGRRQEVSVQVLVRGARKVVQGGFIATRTYTQTNPHSGASYDQAHTMVFKREGKGRYPIRTLRSVSIPQAFLNKSVLAAVQAVSIESFDKNYRQQLRFLGSR